MKRCAALCPHRNGRNISISPHRERCIVSYCLAKRRSARILPWEERREDGHAVLLTLALHSPCVAKNCGGRSVRPLSTYRKPGFLPPYTHSNVHVRKQVGLHDRTFVLQISGRKLRAPIHSILSHTHHNPCRRFGEQRLPLDSTSHRVELTVYRACSTRTTVSASSRIDHLRRWIVASVGLQALSMKGFRVSTHVTSVEMCAA